MTKEEYIDKYPIVCNNEGTKLYLDINDVLKAMDKWGEQQAIAFDVWKIDHKYKASLNMFGELGYEDDTDYWHSPQDIYNKFIEQQNKSNGNKV